MHQVCPKGKKQRHDAPAEVEAAPRIQHSTPIPSVPCIYAQSARKRTLAGRFFKLQNNNPIHVTPLLATVWPMCPGGRRQGEGRLRLRRVQPRVSCVSHPYGVKFELVAVEQGSRLEEDNVVIVKIKEQAPEIPVE